MTASTRLATALAALVGVGRLWGFVLTGTLLLRDRDDAENPGRVSKRFFGY
jgi:hypothetical protein